MNAMNELGLANENVFTDVNIATKSILTVVK
jgi:hypothetical protein